MIRAGADSHPEPPAPFTGLPAGASRAALAPGGADTAFRVATPEPAGKTLTRAQCMAPVLSEAMRSRMLHEYSRARDGRVPRRGLMGAR